jgi:hypothetical protein
MHNKWAVEWHSKGIGDGDTRHFNFIWNGAVPYLFRTRKEARLFVEERYGFIRDRKDLQAEPYGWRMPKPVKVRIDIVKL